MLGLNDDIAMILLIISFIGYILFARKVFKLQWEFIPITVFSTIAVICFIGGLLEQLVWTASLLMIAGLIAFVTIVLLSFRNRSMMKKLPSIRLFHICFFGGTALFLGQLAKEQFIHYDNFSHWAIVLKVMLSTDAFPSYDASLIDFKNYPLGTSAFIYYICRFAGESQSVMLIAQGMLIFACFYAIFGIISLKRRFLLYAFLGLGLSTLSFFNLTVRINNLLVDFLLPILTLTLFAAAYRYRKELVKSGMVIAPVAGLLTVVKSTGIIFAAIGLIFFLFMALKNTRPVSWKLVLTTSFTVCSALLPYFGWNRRMSGTFSQVENKFDIDPASSMQDLGTGKTAEQMNQIAQFFLESSLDMTTRPTLGIVIFQVAAIVMSLVAVFLLRKKWNLWKVMISLDVVLIGYYLGILALYLFLMPLDEAIQLAGFERYASSIVVLFAGGLVMCATIDLERSFYYQHDDIPDSRAFKNAQTKGIYQKGIWVCTALAVTLLLSEYNGIRSMTQSYETTLPYKVEKVTGDRWYADGKEDTSRYLFYSSDANLQVTNYYLQYIARYFLYAPNVDGIVLFYEDNMDNLLSGYDYLVVVEKDDDAARLLKKHYHVDLEERIYKISRDGDQIKLD